MNRHENSGKMFGPQAFSDFWCSSRYHLSDIWVFLVLIGALVTTSPADAKGGNKSPVKKETTWIMDQISDEAGRGELVVNQRGVRIKMKTLTAIVTAPKFDAIIFDTSSKKFVELPFKVWSERYKEKNPAKITDMGRTEKIAGLTAKCFSVPSKKVVKEVWFTKDIPVSDDMCQFISTTMHLPGGHGMPIRMEVIRRGRGKERLFDTLKLSKSEKADPRIFDKPVGFKRVDSEYQLFVKEDSVKDMGSFLE